MNPYSGTSSLAQVRLTQQLIDLDVLSLQSHLQHALQVLRISAASFGFVYGGVKLGYLKVTYPAHLLGPLRMGQ